MNIITVETSAVKRIKELRTEKSDTSLRLRITVEGGGCSGFQYKLALTSDKNDDDQIFGEDETVITDETSIPFLEGTTISFENGLIGSEFKLDNPNAIQGCGCGASFSI